MISGISSSGDAGREVADGLVAERVPVRDRDAVGVEAVVLLAHRAGADARAADRVSAGRHQIPWNFVMRPRATIETNHASARIDREAVEVALGETRRAQRRGHAAAEHVGQAATAPLVEQDEEGQQEAGDAEQHLQDELEDLHSRKPFAAIAVGSHKVKYTVQRRQYDATRASDADVLLEADDRRELVDDEARTADEGTVDVGLAHEARDVARLHRSAVEDAGARRGILRRACRR